MISVRSDALWPQGNPMGEFDVALSSGMQQFVSGNKEKN
jgi:hypothetical protein